MKRERKTFDTKEREYNDPLFPPKGIREPSFWKIFWVFLASAFFVSVSKQPVLWPLLFIIF